MLRFLKLLFAAPPPGTEDGFGQGAAEDARFVGRFRACRRRAVTWRAPSDAERAAWEAHPIVGRFGDWTEAVAEAEGRRWVVRSRTWHGWPDPEEFAFFVLEGDTVWAAADFDRWPRAWTPPPGSKP